MNRNRQTRRTFCAAVACSAIAAPFSPSFAGSEHEHSVDVVIVGGGLGGCAAAIAALRNGLQVVMTESTDWIGGQLTSQGVPPDEHHLIETSGANQSYRELRSRIRKYYRDNYPLTDTARQNPHLNPGNGNVSRLCAEPKVSLAVLEQWLAPYEASGQLVLLRDHVATTADVQHDQVRAVSVRSTKTGQSRVLRGKYFVDATELGDLLPITQTEFVTGSEAQSQTNELHASETADPNNHQAFTMCFAVDHLAGEDHTIDRPEEFSFWRDFVPPMVPPWPGRLLDLTYSHPPTGNPKRLGFDPLGGKSTGGALNLWTYRRMIDRSLFTPGRFAGDISLINWPQNDYLLGNLVGVSDDESARHIARAKQLSLSLLYWLQTEAPRPDGGTGFPGLRLRPDLMGTQDGLAKTPYVRESRRIQAEFTVLEEHVGRENRSKVTGKPTSEIAAAAFADSVGVGSYAIDLHPSSGGDNYIDFSTFPFQVPLGSLLPTRMQNLLPACKNIGTTHITSGCYRLHPVEWGIGEAVGCLVSFALKQKQTPHAIRSNEPLLNDFQKFIRGQGVQTQWS
ncbi:3-ketosteroid-delta-1-dehydrogenase [Rubripirellula lacrimiformis]|uniref:3-ketosteroid-delta-1-dehydrogenase n=1 Tax=Rubripirellula lacrimiformis TaxID=1930273 RepID=A0A517N4W8_9BACT|nr:FAD-dependent oxidoreductase [Rubripirellula lacrimiformis]QDT02177.1 3-ketosteroid-delta-1-dehydrogenase [Rubripirellula lacrimiformis]